MPNPYGLQPIHHLQTTDDECYGVPEHANAYGPQNAINKLVATLMSTTDAQGFKSRYALQKSGTIDENSYADPDDDGHHGPTRTSRPSTTSPAPSTCCATSTR